MARLCDLSEEVLEEIMLLLTPESLGQFKCVSKSWYVFINGLINDPVFVAKHLRYMENKTFSSPVLHFRNLMTRDYPEGGSESVEDGTYFLTLANDDCDDRDSIPSGIGDLQFLIDRTHIDKIEVCHCNGIVCLSTIWKTDNVVLLNPALKEIKMVPHSLRLADDYEVWGVGFGYDSEANDYKVVVIWSHMHSFDGLCTAQVYSLSTNSWKEIQLDERILDFVVDYQVVYSNGVCYWYYWNNELTITSFDFGDEVFCNIPVPDNDDGEAKDWDELANWTRIGVWNESLVLFYYAGEAPKVIEMWVMDSYSDGDSDDELSDSWTKYLTIGPLVGIARPLAIWGKDQLFMETEGGEIISYDLSTEEFGDRSISLKWYKSYRLVFFVKSLVSLLKREGREARP